MKSATKPQYAQSGLPIAQFIDAQIEVQKNLGRSQREIAEEMGYENPNMLSMLKRGAAKLPLDKVPVMAKALRVDPALVFRLAMQQYWPGLEKAIGDIFGTVLTERERELVEFAREATKGEVPRLTGEMKRQLKAALTS